MKLVRSTVNLVVTAAFGLACGKTQGPNDAATGGSSESLHALYQSHRNKRETGPGLCAATFVDKMCKASDDCSIVTEDLDICRTTAHIGVSARGRAEFEARPKKDPCEGKPCPACVVHWSFAEDCDMPQLGEARVECVAGRCLTRAH